jgi:hypothetical protein
MTITLVLFRQKQEDHKFESSLGHIASLKPSWIIHEETLSQKTKDRGCSSGAEVMPNIHKAVCSIPASQKQTYTKQERPSLFTSVKWYILIT